MAIQVLKLRGKMAENGLTVEEFCERINMAKPTYYRKVNEDGRGFTLEEINAIIETLSLTQEETIAIFLPQFSQK